MKRPQWTDSLRSYENGQTARSLLQLASSVLPYLALGFLMHLALIRSWPYWVVLLLSLPAAGFLVRTFILQHDCGHGSFFRSRVANSIVGSICGFLTFTPYFDFKKSHAMHHGTVANLDRRGAGDVWTMTLDEYCSAPPLTRFVYRAVRNPFFFFLVLPPLIFVLFNRFPQKYSGRRELLSILLTDLVVAAAVYLTIRTVGFGAYVAVQGPTIYFASMAGVWLFFIQHQYENVYWAHDADWDPIRASLEGSSFYDLPPVLRFFSGNIGFHHIHHLDSRIPNYRLKQCNDATEQARSVHPIGLWEGFRSLSLHLWDESTGKLVRFRGARKKAGRA
ncbi:MAG TPA: fatty acid desaturase [Rectinemataceae bacterium]|nr:fatty acid desaturase [Rectinemataceae bacterium]